MSGVAYGLLAALGIGVGNVLATIASRRFGTLKTTAVTLATALAMLLAFALVTGVEFEMPSGVVLLLAGLGLAAGIAYLASYQSLRLGPVSVVSPIGATTGAATVAFAFLLMGERPTAIQWVGVPIATCGAVLASIVIEPGLRVRIVGMGPVFAALGVVTGAISNAVLRVPIRDVGPIQSIVGQRTFTVIYVGLTLMVVSIVHRSGGRPVAAAPPAITGGSSLPPALEPIANRGSGVPLLLVIGLLDAVSFAAFARGVLVAPAWLIGLLSQSGRVITVLAGLLLFREHLRPSQWWGTTLVVVGLALAVLG